MTFITEDCKALSCLNCILVEGGILDLAVFGDEPTAGHRFNLYALGSESKLELDFVACL